MSLQNLLELSEGRDNHKQGLSEERLKEQVPALRNLIAFYREYPDYLVDFMKAMELNTILFKRK